MDLERGWPTGRLDLEPLAVAHAAELAPLLDDAALHEFTGGTPLSAAALDRHDAWDPRPPCMPHRAPPLPVRLTPARSPEHEKTQLPGSARTSA
jgi:hypothetical protein